MMRAETLRLPGVLCVLMCIALISVAGCALPSTQRPPMKEAHLILDTSQRYQTFGGWGGEIPNLHWNGFDEPRYEGPTTPVPEALRQQIIDELVDDFGLTRCETTIFSELVEKTNDDNDPFHVNPAGFDFSAVDPYIREFVVPLQEKVRTRGEPFLFSLKVTPGLPKGVKGLGFHRRNPDEYAELAVVLLQHIRELGVETQFLTIENEPDLHPKWTPAAFGEAIARIGERIRAAGFATKISAPETMAPGAVPMWLGAAANARGALPYLGMITYHSYDYDPTLGERPPVAPRITVANWGTKLGLPTAQKEQSSWQRRAEQMWSPQRYNKSLDLSEMLIADLNFAQVSQWDLYMAFQVNFKGGSETPMDCGLLMVSSDYTSLYRPRYSWALRQFTRSIRPGAVRVASRVGAETDVHATAFLSPRGKLVLVLLNRSRQPVQLWLHGVATGEYRMSRSSPNENGVDLPAVQFATIETRGPVLPPESVTSLWQE